MEKTDNKNNTGYTMNREDLVTAIISRTKGDFATEGVTREIGLEAFDMGMEYAGTHRFSNSSRYHNYQYILEDGGTVSASSYYSIFTTRTQTPAYMKAEEDLAELFADDKDMIFHLVRDQRFGINGVFKAVMSPRETQQLNVPDYTTVIACFCAGAVMGKHTS